jgi:general secretion pathway protein J
VTKLNAKHGFTLIEMLVVLVIVSLTTSLLMTGLSNTWRNFERLGARELSLSAGMIGASWFRQSIEGAVMYHPFSNDFRGNSSTISMITFNAPFSSEQTPQKISWRIVRKKNLWVLELIDSHQQKSYLVEEFDTQVQFEYLSGGGWQSQFSQERNTLPAAIRILVGNVEWIRIYPKRPLLSDMPVEYPAFGVYEF